MTRHLNRRITALLASTALTALPMPGRAVELPSGGSVAHGSVGISSPSANALSIQQSSQTAIVNWQTFSVGQGGRVDISQPSSSSALLNRVTGSTSSTIAGQLNANGQVYLVNPNGIAITPTGIVRAGAFVGSTLDIADEDFKAGRRVFRGTGRSAPVSNAGSIDIIPGGYAALLGGQVENSGEINVPQGRVGLGAGEQATLDLSGDGFLQVAIPSRSEGSEALIRQSGRIRASGGLVTLQAATARDAARNAINMSGLVEARTVSGRSGAIVLGGGEGGSVTVTGRLDASAHRGRRAGSAAGAARGGAITITGDAITLAGAKLDATGMAGGGRIRVGGDAQGGGSLQRASTTRIDAATTLRADAGATGNGGSVVVWSDTSTEFAGRIIARGGSTSGDGGSAEVSGKARLTYDGQADLSAAHGAFGTLLLDPYNVFITNGTGTGTTQSGGVFTAGANDSVINATTLANALATANVTVTTGGAGSPGAQAGDIAVQANVGWTAPTTLTLSAFRNITIGESPTSPNAVTIAAPTGGGVVLRSDNSGTGTGTVTFFNSGTGGGSVSAATGSNVAIYYNPASNPAGSDVNTTSYTDPTNYAILTGNGGVIGNGTLVASMLVNTAADLQNMRNAPTASYALGRSIDAAGASAFNDGTGFAPIVGGEVGFSGRFDGLGQTISNLTITQPGQSGVGLFGATTGATLANVTLVAANVTGGDNTGGLVGLAQGGSISGVGITGRVAGANTTGGLAGGAIGTAIANASSAATVTGTDNVGGLVGVTNGGSVSRSFATGPVTGGLQVGGLVGLAQSTAIGQSYATGAVTGTDFVGGLVGALGGEGDSLAPGTIGESYANGAVTSQGRAGGLVGLASNGGQVTNAYATGLTRGATAAGGLIGEINSVPGDSNAPVVVANTYATGLVAGGGAVGGLIGNVVGTLQTVGTSYWDTQTTGVPTSAGPGATGLTTAQLQGALPAGFAAATWGTQASAYPYLTWRYPTGVLAVSGLTRAAADPGTPIAAEPVRVAAGGTLSYQTNSGANGYYYVARDPLAGAAPQGATAYLDGTNRGAGATDAPIGAGAITNLDARIGRTVVATAQATASGLATLLATAGDGTLSGNIPYTVAGTGGVPTFGSGLPTYIEALAATGLTVDRSIVSAGTLQIAGAGSGAGGTVSAGSLTLSAGQTLQSQAGDVIVATSQFVNTAGAAGLQAGGRFLVYSQDYAADQRGGLAGGNLYARTFTANGPATVTQAGSQFIYTRQPVLTVSATDATRTYGPTALGFTRSITGLVNGDTAAVAFTGTSTVTDTTTAATGVGTYAGAAQVAQGTLASTIGYAFAFVNAPVTITPAPLTIRAADATKLYGDTLAFTGTEFAATGLVNGNQVARVDLSSSGAAAIAPVSGSPYAIVAANPQGTGLTSATGASNYTVTYVPGALTVTPAPLTIRANDATKEFGTTLTFTGTEFVATGLRNADRVAAVTLASDGAPATAPVAGSPYAILASGGQGDGLANYAVTYVPGALTVEPQRISPLSVALTAPTLDRQQPTSFIPVSDPADTIVVAETGGGPTLGPGSRRDGLPTGDDTLDALESAGKRLDAAVAACEEPDKRRIKVYNDCVARSLETYADALEARIAQLPPALRNIPNAVRLPRALQGGGARTGGVSLRSVPDVIRAAARQVRAARTVVQARNVVRAVVAVVRKAITLIRADEPALATRQVRHGNAIASALQSVDNRLSRAVGL